MSNPYAGRPVLTRLEGLVYRAMVDCALAVAGGDFGLMDEVDYRALGLTPQRFGGVVTSLQNKGYVNVDDPLNVNQSGDWVTQFTVWTPPDHTSPVTEEPKDTMTKKTAAKTPTAPKLNPAQRKLAARIARDAQLDSAAKLRLPATVPSVGIATATADERAAILADVAPTQAQVKATFDRAAAAVGLRAVTPAQAKARGVRTALAGKLAPKAAALVDAAAGDVDPIVAFERAKLAPTAKHPKHGTPAADAALAKVAKVDTRKSNGLLPKGKASRPAKVAPASPVVAPARAGRVRIVPAPGTAACPKCGRVNPSGKACRVPSACRRRASAAKAASVGSGPVQTAKAKSAKAAAAK